MLLSQEKYCQARSSSVKALSRQKSIIKIPSTSQIPKDFFRQPKSMDRSDPAEMWPKNQLEFTFMPNRNESSLSQKAKLQKNLD